MSSSDIKPADIDERFFRYRDTGSRRLRNELVEEHRGLAITIAGDYVGRGAERDDLNQVATLGLVKAVDRYDPDRGVPFGAYASRTINGELKRHLRDKTWSVRPPRSIQERYLEVRRAVDDLSQDLGRSPTIPEIAAHLDVDEDDVIEGLEAGDARRPASLDRPVDDDESIGPAGVGVVEAGIGQTEAAVTVAALMDGLDEREAMILRLRFEENLSQDAIAERVGISQMHVSRLLRRTLEQLRAKASELEL